MASQTTRKRAQSRTTAGRKRARTQAGQASQGGENETGRLLRLLTFNVHAYQGSANGNTTTPRRGAAAVTENAVRAVIAGAGADIVAVQEDISTRRFALSGAHAEAAHCDAQEYHRGGRLRNVILVAQQHVAADARRVNVTAGCPVRRCAAVIRCAGLVVANVHLCGGRFDDPSFRSLVHAKSKALERLLDAADPDVVVGDFNAERSEQRVTANLSGYDLYRQLKGTQREEFVRYYRACHDVMDARGYAPAFDDAMLQTNAFGGLSDWVYVRTHLLPRVRRVEVIPALHCSDHNAVLVELQWP